ncbi:MAG: hypothetical protein WA678_00630 [Rhabdochlamydiaceae bacterium]
MTYSSFLQLDSKVEYQTQWEIHYCKHPVFTFDDICVRFQKGDFDHAFYESIKSKSSKDVFSKKRAERLHWIKAALQDPKSERFAGWNNIKRRHDHTRRVTVVTGNYVVVIALLSKKVNEARFITAYVADTIGKNGRPSTIDLIRSGPLWESKKIKIPLIRQAGSAEAFIGSTITDEELPSI